MTIKVTAYDRLTGEVGACCEADDPASLAHLETEKTAYIEGHFPAELFTIDIATGEPVPRETPREPPLEFLLLKVRNKRSKMLDDTDWTTGRDSPLSPECQEEWSTYRKALHALLKDKPHPAEIVWPEPPSLVYAPEEEA